MNRVRLPAVAIGVALLSAACTMAPESTGTPDPAPTSPTSPAITTTADATPSPTPPGDPSYLACQVTDSSGVHDASLNQLIRATLMEMAHDVQIAVSVHEPATDAEADDALAAALAEGCNLIIASSPALAPAVEAAAQANPFQHYVIIDHDYVDNSGTTLVYDNVTAITFDTSEAAVLAGYLAAALTDTGIVGAFGQEQRPDVTVVLDGFRRGVRHHNAVRGAEVVLRGWDGTVGRFIDGDDTLIGGREVAETLLDDGADIILPVAIAGAVGTAELMSEEDAGLIIWLGGDGFEVIPNHRDRVLTSVLRRSDVLVRDIIAADMAGTHRGGRLIGTLANGGVDLAPYHVHEVAVPQALRDALADLKQRLIAGDDLEVEAAS